MEDPVRVENARVLACMVEPMSNDPYRDDADILETTSVLPCAVEKKRELDRRRGAVTVPMVTEEPVTVEKASPFE